MTYTKHAPTVCIIIANWQQYELTSQTLESLGNQNYKNIKIILVDNESDPGKLKSLHRHFPKISVIKNKVNLGFSKANNQGIKFALKNQADFILLLNNDVEVKKDFLTTLVDYCISENYSGILNPKILYHKSHMIWAMGGKLSTLTSIPRMIGQGSNSNDFINIIKPDYACGCALFASVSVFKKVGFLDETFFAYYEDTDFSFRAKCHGISIRVIPKSIIWHKVSRSTSHNAINKLGEFQSYLYAKNGLVFGSKNFSGLKRIYYIANSLTIKTLLYLIFKCEGVSAQKSYLNGILDGLKLIMQFPRH